MFTGIIKEVGEIKKVESISGGIELQITCSFAEETRPEESISVNGVCLTVTNQSKHFFTVQCVKETLGKTTMGALSEGSPVNLERALTLDKALDGHIVQGHVDTIGTITDISLEGTDRLIQLECPSEYSRYIVGRGSITVDGISLTVARAESDRFIVAIIPYTWSHTNLNSRKQGDKVNLEFDIFGKYIIHYLDKRFAESA